MDWDGYTVSSVICGIACVLFGALGKDLSGKTRGWAALGGLFSIGYGFYVAAQDSGVYYFSSYIFVVPLLLAGKIVYDMVKKQSGSHEREKRTVRLSSNVNDRGHETTDHSHDAGALTQPDSPKESDSPKEPAFAPHSQDEVLSDLISAPPPTSRGAEPAGGWYQDPLSSRYQLRYWDGRAWTERVD